MAGIDVMREYVSSQYSGYWPEKVKKMPDSQVARIYHRMIDELKKERQRKKDPRITEKQVRGGIQLCLFEGKGTKVKEGYLNERDR